MFSLDGKSIEYFQKLTIIESVCACMMQYKNILSTLLFSLTIGDSLELRLWLWFHILNVSSLQLFTKDAYSGWGSWRSNTLNLMTPLFCITGGIQMQRETIHLIQSCLPLLLKSSIMTISARYLLGVLLMTLWTVRISVDQPSLWNTMITLEVSNLSS